MKRYVVLFELDVMTIDEASAHEIAGHFAVMNGLRLVSVELDSTQPEQDIKKH